MLLNRTQYRHALGPYDLSNNLLRCSPSNLTKYGIRGISCTRMTTVGVKGLTTTNFHLLLTDSLSTANVLRLTGAWSAWCTSWTRMAPRGASWRREALAVFCWRSTAARYCYVCRRTFRTATHPCWTVAASVHSRTTCPLQTDSETFQTNTKTIKLFRWYKTVK